MQPIKMKDSVVSIAGTDHGGEASAVQMTPSTPVSTWKGLKPDAVHSSAGTTTWTCDMTIGVDWDDATSLSRYLFEHAGEKATLEFRPRTGGTGMSVEVILIPGAIGGSVDSDAEATVSLPATGQPTFLPATP